MGSWIPLTHQGSALRCHIRPCKPLPELLDLESPRECVGSIYGGSFESEADSNSTKRTFYLKDIEACQTWKRLVNRCTWSIREMQGMIPSPTQVRPVDRVGLCMGTLMYRRSAVEFNKSPIRDGLASMEVG